MSLLEMMAIIGAAMLIAVIVCMADRIKKLKNELVDVKVYYASRDLKMKRRREAWERDTFEDAWDR